MNKEKITIIIADDHEVTRYGLTVMLGSQDGLHKIAEASDGKELLSLTETYRPNVVITDVEMPGMDGREATRIITENYPETAVIGLSMHDDLYSVIDMLEAGAKGYLLKNASKEESLRAIETVRRDEHYYSDAIKMKLAKFMAAGKYQKDNSFEMLLTERERVIIGYICKQYSSKRIAEVLNLSVRTIEGYRDNILRKTDSLNTVGIVMYAMRNKLFV